jgi:ATP-dependent DNA helicase DinG
MESQVAQITDIFGKEGKLAQAIPGFSPREVQLKMAMAISNALAKSQVLIAEAGTGTGKTYAYLIPSLISGKKIVISTATKNLQDQLFHRDLPLIRKVLAIPMKIALLKGRGNYLCLHRLQTYSRATFIAASTLNVLSKVKQWAEYSRDGEIEQISGVKLEPTLLPYITSTTDNCLGQECEFATKCFLLKARRQAQEAGILVINHHLFFANSQLRESGVMDFLPDTEVIVFDEAHQLHEIASHFLGESISARQLQYLARDIRVEQQAAAADMEELKSTAEKLTLASKTMLQAFGNFTKGSWENIAHKPQIKAGIEELQSVLKSLQPLLEAAAVRSKGLENCNKRLLDALQRFTKLTDTPPKEMIHWYEVQNANFSIHHTPLDVSNYFQNLINEKPRAWIFTSATLSISGNFRHFEDLLGLKQPKQLCLDSPFDYPKQAILYLPKITCSPHDEHYLTSILEVIVPLLEITRGRAFILFTSHKALKESATQLASRVSFPLLVQGNAPKSQLLKQFCELENAVLLGTSSFWEGIDVKGNKLSCVIIDKIPFVAPDDPILKTRLEHYRKQGMNPFTDYQLPQSVIMLRQGAGRLIRDKDDKGVLMLCDPRLRTKDYGKVFLASLPAMKISHSLSEVADFLRG